MCHSFASLKDRSEFAVGERAFGPELAEALGLFGYAQGKLRRMGN